MKEKVSRESAIQNLTAIMYLFMATYPKRQVCFNHYTQSDQLHLFFDGDEEETAKEWLERAKALTLSGAEVDWKHLGYDKHDHYHVVAVEYMFYN